MYTDPSGAPPERLEVLDDAGELVARFTDGDGDTELVPIADMAGTFARA
jgi:hypothetical protein